MSRILVVLCTVAFVALLPVSLASQCKLVSSTSYDAADGTVITDAAYIVSFKAECPSNGLSVCLCFNQ